MPLAHRRRRFAAVKLGIAGIHKWCFSAEMIKAVSASKRDDRSMFLYVHENSDDFNLVFPSAAHCDKYALFLCSHLFSISSKGLFIVSEIPWFQFQNARKTYDLVTLQKIDYRLLRARFETESTESLLL